MQLGKTVSNDKKSQLVKELSALDQCRFKKLLKNGLGIDIKTIPVQNYPLALMVLGCKGESLPSIKHRVHFFTQIDNFSEFPELEKIPQDSAHLFHTGEAFAHLIKDLGKLADLTEKIGSFLQNTNIYILVLLYALTHDSPDFPTQEWNRAIKRLLF